MGWVRGFILKAHDIALLTTSLAVLILLVFMCWYADSKDLWPTGPWGAYEGNHGPWRVRWLRVLQAYGGPLYIVNRTLWRIFELQFITTTISMVGLLFKPELNRVLLFIINFLFFLVLMENYYWLID